MSVAGDSSEGSDVTVTGEPGEVVTVEAPEHEEEGGERETAGDKPNRKERRTNVMRETKERAEASERREREVSDRLARAERETAELRGFVASQAQQRKDNPQTELAAAVDRLDNEAQEHLMRSALASKAGDAAMAAREMKAFNAKNREAARLEMRAEMEPELDRRVNEVAGRFLSPEVQETKDRLGGEFGWLRTDSEARAMVDDKINQLRRAGRPDAYETYREACAAVAKRLNLGGRQAPTDASRQRLQGVPSGEGAGGGEGSVQIIMGDKEKRLAHAMYRNLEPKEAEKAAARDWAKAKREGTW